MTEKAEHSSRFSNTGCPENGHSEHSAVVIYCSFNFDAVIHSAGQGALGAVSMVIFFDSREGEGSNLAAVFAHRLRSQGCCRL